MAVTDYDHLLEEANLEPETCAWPIEGTPTSPLCGRRAQAVYVGNFGVRHPRCHFHDSAAVRTHAESTGFTRVDLTPARQHIAEDSWPGFALDQA